MSRWLSSVNNFLEKLDDQAQDYVEENINLPREGENEADKLDSILALRGLQVAASEDDDDLDAALKEMEDQGQVEGDAKPSPPDTVAEETQQTQDELSKEQPSMEAAKQTGQPSSEERDKKEQDAKPPPPAAAASTTTAATTTTTSTEPLEESKSVEKKGEEEKTTAAEEKAGELNSANHDEKNDSIKDSESKKAVSTKQGSTAKPALPPPPLPKGAPAIAKTTSATTESQPAPKNPVQKVTPPPPPPPPPKSEPSSAPVAPVVKDPNPALVKEAREAQKEVRTLRRHVVALNKQLETVEAEVTAQRQELDQVGDRMEKERTKAKTERDNERKRHAEEMQKMQSQHEQTLMDQKARMEQQIATMSQRLKDVEQTRAQEGGNWDKELQDAVERERELVQKNASLEDEKATLLAQINTLQSQQEALGDRVESLSQTADSAMEREREAEERLDQALSVHAHQISQRQTRERELERTIAELTAAMASVRSKESSRLSNYNKSGSEVSDTAGENTSQDSGLRVRLDMALHDLETAQANLDLERQRAEALQRELKDVSNERTEEATNARMRQNKYDRQIAELTLQLSRLQQQSAEIGQSGKSKNMDSSSRNDAEVHDLKNQIKELSEEVLKAREKAGSYSSEMATLKSRLKGAVDRATQAETAMEEAMAIQNTDSYDRMERASPQSGTAMRRRGVGRSGSGAKSITSVMQINQSERVGKAIDAIDTFSVSTGKYLQINPMARAAFLVYLALLHLWTFVVIFFHAHNFEDIHRDQADMPHGPDAIVRNQIGAGGQAVQAAVSAAKAAATAAKPKAP